MGEFGLAGRVLSLRMGSALAYAAVEQATAPGQLSLDAMIDLYRAAQITRRTRVYGVIGDPIGHSLSPLLHNTAFRARKFDAVFVPFLVRNLRDFLGAMEGFGVAGLAVTIPHKETILRSSGRLRSAGGAHRSRQYRGRAWRRAIVRVQYGLRRSAAQPGAADAPCGEPRAAVWGGRRGESGCVRAGAGGLDRLPLCAASGARPRAGSRRRGAGRWRARIWRRNFSMRL